MNKILIAAATKKEVEPILSFFEEESENLFVGKGEKSNLHLLITAIGVINVTYNLMKNIRHNKYSLIINVGITGAFNQELRIGQVVNVVSEQMADLGIETAIGFFDFFDADWHNANDFPFEEKRIKADFIIGDLPKVNNLTVCTATGMENRVRELRDKFNSDTENMEGFAVFFVAKKEKIPVAQIKAVSNHVEARNVKNWNIPLAIKNLNDFLITHVINTPLNFELKH